MKKILLGMAALVASVLPCHADTSGAYAFPVANQVVTATTSWVVDLSAIGVDAVSFQITASSVSPTTQTFKDGTQSTGSITVVTNSALSAQASSDTISVVTNSALVATAGTATLTVSSNTTAATGGIIGSTFTIAGSSVVGGVGYSVGASSNATAINIAAAINTSITNVNATVTSPGVVTITCVNTGVFCNSYTITSSTPAALGVTSFANGADNSFFTLNGTVYPQGSIWSADPTYSSMTAVNIANGISTISGYTASTMTTTIVLVKLATAGTFGNAYTLTSSTGALKILSAKFLAGQDNAFLSINGRILTQGSQWTAGATGALTATSIYTAINADPVLSTIMVATSTSFGSSVVSATGTINLTGNNYLWYSSTSSQLSVTNSGLYGGTTSAYLINTGIISLPSHTLATGEEVKFTSGTINLSPLVNQTSYYAIYVDANDIELALTSTGAIAGTFITLTSSSTAGPHTFTLTPLSLAGSELFTWSESNDCVNFSTATATASNVTIPLNALSTTWAQTIYGYDFGNVNYRCVRLTATGPSTAGNGGFNTVVAGYGKRYWR